MNKILCAVIVTFFLFNTISCEFILDQDSNGDTPLHRAARLGNWKKAQEIFANPKSLVDENLKIQNNSGNTALAEALLNKHWDIANEILRKRSGSSISFGFFDKNLTNIDGKTELDIAKEMGAPKTVLDILEEQHNELNKTAAQKALKDAIGKDDLKLVQKLLLEAKITTEKEYTKLLKLAINYNADTSRIIIRPKVAAYFISKGANVDEKNFDIRGAKVKLLNAFEFIKEFEGKEDAATEKLILIFLDILSDKNPQQAAKEYVLSQEPNAYTQKPEPSSQNNKEITRLITALSELKQKLVALRRALPK